MLFIDMMKDGSDCILSCSILKDRENTIKLNFDANFSEIVKEGKNSVLPGTSLAAKEIKIEDSYLKFLVCHGSEVRENSQFNQNSTPGTLINLTEQSAIINTLCLNNFVVLIILINLYEE